MVSQTPYLHVSPKLNSKECWTDGTTGKSFFSLTWDYWMYMGISLLLHTCILVCIQRCMHQGAYALTHKLSVMTRAVPILALTNDPLKMFYFNFSRTSSDVPLEHGLIYQS